MTGAVEELCLISAQLDALYRCKKISIRLGNSRNFSEEIVTHSCKMQDHMLLSSKLLLDPKD